MLLVRSMARGQSVRARGLERILTSPSSSLVIHATGSPTRKRWTATSAQKVERAAHIQPPVRVKARHRPQVRSIPLADKVLEPDIGFCNRRGSVALATTPRVIFNSSAVARDIRGCPGVVHATNPLPDPFAHEGMLSVPAPGLRNALALQATSFLQSPASIGLPPAASRGSRPPHIPVTLVPRAPNDLAVQLIAGGLLKVPVSTGARSPLLAAQEGLDGGITLHVDLSTIAALGQPRPATSAAGENNIVCAAGSVTGHVYFNYQDAAERSALDHGLVRVRRLPPANDRAGERWQVLENGSRFRQGASRGRDQRAEAVYDTRGVRGITPKHDEPHLRPPPCSPATPLCRPFSPHPISLLASRQRAFVIAPNVELSLPGVTGVEQQHPRVEYRIGTPCLTCYLH
ncbi:hypothetical protein AURDEDRAFT_172327 [Auricularia subglabra TFB-10046 SS5]|nr:hypothetical protein AURDEDRAFT_172327 [Auricularia subglabra TFB-10046 SS5]